jgi:hypothetical protein
MVFIIAIILYLYTFRFQFMQKCAFEPALILSQ